MADTPEEGIADTRTAPEGTMAVSEATKASMSKLILRDDDIVTLNVGGEIFACLRDTLRQVKGSMLERMFDTPWYEQLKRDSNGHVFLDWNPAAFRMIINHLRLCRLEGSLVTGVPDAQALGPGDLQGLQALVRYLELEPIGFVTVDQFDPTWRHDGVALERDNRSAVFKQPDCNVAGANSYIAGTVQWTLVLERLPEDGQVYLGLVDTAKVSQSLAPGARSDAAGAYLWRVRDPNDACANKVVDETPYEGWRQGDTVTITLDTGTLEATMCISRVGVVNKMTVEPSTAGWRLFVRLVDVGKDPVRVTLVPSM